MTLPVWSALPFVLLVLAIAFLPLAAPRWWEPHRNKAIVSAALAIPFATLLVIARGAEAAAHLGHSLLDYVSFLALLGSLFVISGGIHVRGSLAGTPLAITALLGIGAVLANLVGTTGASMLLVRPLLRAIRRRRRKAHAVVFFMFVVSNCGGLLTPLGDPPLFLGFLKGVPFTWTLGLWKEWLLVNGVLLLVFNLVDQAKIAAEEREGPEHEFEEVLEHEPVRIEGGRNFLFLCGVVLAILARGEGWGTGGEPWPFGIQEGLLAALAAASFVSTAPRTRQRNAFTFGPILEVAVLFAGIFTTMVAPLLLLHEHGPSLGLDRPWQYFWAAGSLSSFLDNAPTYLTFAAAVAGEVGVPVTDPRFLGAVVARGEPAEALLAAVSCGAVLMGANTYIGNGPNFMVKAIAEESGVRMPSFFGYALVSGAVLLPLFAAVSALFFR